MKIRHRLILFLLGSAVLTAILLGVAGARILAGTVRESAELRVAGDVRFLASEVARIPAGDLPAFAARASRDFEVRVTMIASDGSVVAESSADASRMENHLHRPEIAEAELRGAGTAVRRSATTGNEYHYAAARIDAGGPVRFVRAAVPVAELERVEGRQLLVLLMSSIAGLLVLSFLFVVIVRRFTRPVEQMTAAAERVAAGGHLEDVPEPREEELSRLAHAINRMKRSLVAKVKEVQVDQQLLVAMREGMEEGLLLVGPDGRILMVNGAFGRIFRIPVDPVGRLLGEVVRHPGVLKIIEDALTSGDDRREAVSGTPGSDRSFEIHARSVDIPGSDTARGVLVLLFDITRLEALENVRRQFIADVSHELRTPITSIAAALETLGDGPWVTDPDAARFVGMARRQVDRMRDLVADLTDLSLIETGGVRLEIARFDLVPLASDVAATFSARYADRSVRVLTRVPPGFEVVADRRRLEQILVNLVDNGCKFNKRGGEVVIEASKSGGVITIAIRDTGIGIPADALPKIFQRFYRVDRARSAGVTGTGLGLAITKHLVHLHDGEISVTSTVESGSCFTIELAG